MGVIASFIFFFWYFMAVGTQVLGVNQNKSYTDIYFFAKDPVFSKNLNT